MGGKALGNHFVNTAQKIDGVKIPRRGDSKLLRDQRNKILVNYLNIIHVVQMKEIIKVEMKVRTVDFSKCKTDLLVVGQFSDAKGLDKLNKELDGKLGGSIERLIKSGDFKSKEGTSAVPWTFSLK